jgi:hypothetical protein
VGRGIYHQTLHDIRNHKAGIVIVDRPDQKVKAVVIAWRQPSRAGHLDGFEPGQVGQEIPKTEGEKRPVADLELKLGLPPDSFHLFPRKGSRREDLGGQQSSDGDEEGRREPPGDCRSPDRALCFPRIHIRFSA